MNSNRTALEFRSAVAALIVGLTLFLIATNPLAAQGDLLPIGTIQGSDDASPYRGDRVRFRGIVTGLQEDQNTRGVIYYTLFVQDITGAEDGDPTTSDAIAVFFGTNRPQIPIGAQVLVEGEVTEFFGFTEIDDNDLRVTVEQLDGTLPEAVVIDPPADLEEQHAYFEPLEGARVKMDGPARVTGPTHEGCGFAVVAVSDPAEPVLRRQLDDPTGRVIPVLYPTDLDCTDMIPLKTGDTIAELEGVLIYNFDEFKILLVNPADLEVTPAILVPPEPLPELATGQVSAVTINVHDWFDSESLNDNPDEPVFSPEYLAIKEGKLGQAISQWLHCPTLVAIQEVEHEALLLRLAEQLAPDCGFTYTVSHVESGDPRGIDNALLSDPNRVTIHSAQPRQVCSPVPTDHVDATLDCPIGEDILFDRPPLQIDMEVDGYPYVVFVNHFKSKREGEAETALERLAQARFQNALAAELLAADSTRRILVMGDLNDYELSAPLLTLTDPDSGGQLVNAMVIVPETDRYSYVFGGVANLLDTILVSSTIGDSLDQAGIVHLNADFPSAWAEEVEPQVPYRFSDHDMPWIIWRHEQAVDSTAVPAATETPVPTPTEIPTAVPPTMTAVATQPVVTETAAPQDTIVEVATLPASQPLDSGSVATSMPWGWIVGALALAAVGGLVVVVLRRSG